MTRASARLLVLAAVALAALAVLGWTGFSDAARQPSQDESSQIEERTIAWLICCVDATDGAVREISISTTNPRFARADIRITYPGAKALNAVVVLRKGIFGWKVLDAGQHAVGCDEVLGRARVDLGLVKGGRCLRTGA